MAYIKFLNENDEDDDDNDTDTAVFCPEKKTGANNELLSEGT